MERETAIQLIAKFFLEEYGDGHHTGMSIDFADNASDDDWDNLVEAAEKLADGVGE